MRSSWPRNERRAMPASTGRPDTISGRFFTMSWLGNLDSNQDKQSQSLLCYRYTIPQFSNKIIYLCRKMVATDENGSSP
jgi:hypothetical protein